ncbi:MAG TPA: hypothetical protein VGF01_03805 [Terracidiphilus sp.]
MAVELTELIQAVVERQKAMEGQVGELAQTVKALEARFGASAAPASVSAEVQREEETVTPEMLVVIAAAVTAFLGKKVRVRSAKLLRQRSNGVSAWAQQGRVAVHASHHPRLRS